MSLKKNVKQNFEVSFLICTIFTLEPYNNLFTKLNLKKNLHLNSTTKNKNSILINLYNKEITNDLYNLLNKASLRHVAKCLIEPLLRVNSSTPIPLKTKKV